VYKIVNISITLQTTNVMPAEMWLQRLTITRSRSLVVDELSLDSPIEKHESYT